MISGDFNDFHWEADIDEDELDYADAVAVDIKTPTGGSVAFVLYGPWEDLESFTELLVDDIDFYTSMS